MGEQEAAKRNVPTADSVSQNEEGLRQLIVSELLINFSIVHKFIFLSVSCESMFLLIIFLLFGDSLPQMNLLFTIFYIANFLIKFEPGVCL